MNKKTAIVVGTGFIGSHICKILENDFQIVAVDNNKNTLDSIDPSYEKVKLDCLNKEETESAFNNIFKNHSDPTVLVNSLGVDIKINSDDNFATFEVQDINKFEEAIVANLRSVFLTSQSYYKNLKKVNKEGVILNISSDLGHIAPDHRLYNDNNESFPNQKPAHYSVSKFGLEGFTKYLAATTAPLLRVNSLCPSGIMNSSMDEKFQEKLKNLNPQKGIMELNDLNSAVKFLTSEKSKFVNGQSIIIDGGRSIL
jgi:NAD(P)-dependent dehydrogenase (short-subunit alcohol dehydrogenase family)